MPMLFSDTAGASSLRGTRSGTMAWNTGIEKASSVPNRKEAIRTTVGVVSPTAVEKPSSKATMIEAICSRISNFRRSTASPTAPAGNANRNTGRLDSARTRVTMTGVGRSSVISQAVPTLPSQIPIFETRLASHTARKVGIASGVQAEGGDPRLAAAALSLTGLHPFQQQMRFAKVRKRCAANGGPYYFTSRAL